MNRVEHHTKWEPENSLLITRLAGDATSQDIQHWQHGLETALASIEPGTHFKMLVNIYGFKAASFDDHKKFRVILPRTLARVGLRIGYLDLFENADVLLENEEGRQCVAIAHTHHDSAKMDLYEQQCSRHNDRYFRSPDEAMAWIRNFPVSGDTVQGG